MNRALLMLSLLASSPVWAQEVDAASIPDGSAGQGGVDQTSEENEPGTPCLDSRACDRGTICSKGRCVPRPVKDLGCTSAPAGLASGLIAGSALLACFSARRRRRLKV